LHGGLPAVAASDEHLPLLLILSSVLIEAVQLLPHLVIWAGEAHVFGVGSVPIVDLG